MESYQQHFRSPELYGDFWVNSNPVSVRDMRGTVLLVDFWDYSSLHCIRALSYVRDWEKKYRDYGVLVVGVHTPEFPFGHVEENVRRAVGALDIVHPVVGDNEGRIWTSFGARTWPTKFLVDKDGFIRFSHQGEGGYDQFERAIQFLTTEAGMRGELPDLTVPVRETDVPGAICYRTPAEIRTGYLRGAIGNPEGFNPESTVEYLDQGLYLPSRYYLEGRWTCERESVRFGGHKGAAGNLSVGYEALEVTAVMGFEAGKKAKVYVRQDGKWLQNNIMGVDVKVGKDGSTYVNVDSPRLFNIVRNRVFGEHVVRFSTDTPGVRFYSVSFVTSVIPEVVNANAHGIGLN